MPNSSHIQSAAISDSRQLTEFSFSENKKVSALLIDNQPWFIARDICTVLELSDTGKALEKLDDDEKLTRKLFVSGQQREVYLVNESGLYNLIFRSNKAEAKAFRKWVTAVVLPQIRQTGQYSTGDTTRIDYRDQLYTYWLHNEVPVRSIEIDGVKWYEIASYANSIGVFTCAYQLAEKLNKVRLMARKLWLFGMSGSGWFTTQEGINLVTLNNRKKMNLPIPFTQPQLTGGSHD